MIHQMWCARCGTTGCTFVTALGIVHTTRCQIIELRRVMSGLRWTYDQLVQYLGQRSDNAAARGINPVIRQLLAICPGSYIWGLGGHSVVLWISPGIAAKISLQPGDERLRHEQEILALLDRLDRPHLVQCFLRGEDVTFLELLADGTSYDRKDVHVPNSVIL
jgi:hypothetical protein